MSTTAALTDDERGCPSNLAPAREAESFDPAPFVTERDGKHHLALSVTGASCAGCISKIEGALNALPGMEEARLNLSTGRLTTAWRGALPAGRITETLTGLGYSAAAYDPEASREEADERGRFLLRCLAVAGFASANIMLLSVSVWATSGEEMGEATRSLMHLVSGLIAIPAVAFAGRPFFASAWAALKQKRTNMDVPISLAVFLALGVSLFEALKGGEHAYFDAAVMLLFFLLIGRWLDHNLRRKAQSAARDLLALQSHTALRLRADNNVEAVAARSILPGDTLVLEPESRCPVNAEVLEGSSDIDTAYLTGESLPQLAETGDRLFAGTRNLSQRLVVRATSDVEGSLIADLVRLVEAGQQSKDRYTILADKAARLYVPVVHTLAALTLVGWLVIGDGGLREAILAATAVLIITCPCALGLATPAVQVVATGQLFRRGILVKSGNALERLARVRHVVFDKTGTLTVGQLRWQNAEELSDEQRTAVASIARAGHHPIARAVAAASGPGPLAKGTKEVPGRGIEGFVGEQFVRLGSAAFVGLATEERENDGPRAYLRIGEERPVRLSFEDEIKTDGKATINALRARGLGISLLSGDGVRAVSRVAEELGIADHRAGLTPTEKAAIMRDLKEKAPVAMVGDGINDVPALAHADVSLSPGSAADAAHSAADFVFQGDGIGAVQDAWNMAVRARRHILQNFAFAALYNAVAAPAAMLGFVSPLIAALAMSGSSLVVTLNALRLMKEERT
jgi:Cu2+-exporting ATPase